MIKVMIVMALVCPAVFTGCLGDLKSFESIFTVRVSGEKDLKFKGYYAFPGTGSIGRPVNVEGVVPAEYRGKGVTALCMFRSTSPKGSLKVEILKGDTVIGASDTREPYGVITLGKMPNSESMVNLVIGKIMDMLRL